MAVIKRESYRLQRGPLGNLVDWWYLAVETEKEAVFVIHEWSHTQLGAIWPNVGEHRVELAEFLLQPPSARKTPFFIFSGQLLLPKHHRGI